MREKERKNFRVNFSCSIRERTAKIFKENLGVAYEIDQENKKMILPRSSVKLAKKITTQGNKSESVEIQSRVVCVYRTS